MIYWYVYMIKVKYTKENKNCTQNRSKRIELGMIFKSVLYAQRKSQRNVFYKWLLNLKKKKFENQCLSQCKRITHIQTAKFDIIRKNGQISQWLQNILKSKFWRVFAFVLFPFAFFLSLYFFVKQKYICNARINARKLRVYSIWVVSKSTEWI